jgi:hypothetical protein
MHPARTVRLLCAILAALALVPARARAQCVLPPSDLVSWWRAEGNGTDTQGLHDASLVSPASYTTGEVGSAFSMNFGGYVSIDASASDYAITAAITIDAWIRMGGAMGDHAAILTKGDSTWRLARWANTNVLNFGLGDGPEDFQDAIGTTNVNDGNWHFVAGVFDGANGYLYVDGVLDATSVRDHPLPTNAYEVRIGSNAEEPFREWNGQIDEVEIFDRALSASEILAIYNAGPDGKCPPTTTSSSSTSTSSTTTSTSSTTSTTFAAVGVVPTKLIVIDKVSSGKAVFIAKGLGVTKGAGEDLDGISVELTTRYANDAATGRFAIPAGAANGWLLNKSTIAKFVNRAAPAGPTEAKVAIVKPQSVLKLIAKGVGDVDLDIVAAGDPAGDVYTAYCVTNGGGAPTCHCSVLNACAYRTLGGGGAKLVCRGGAADGGCAALAP